MILLGIDVETTGLSIEEDDIIEIGAVFYDWEKKSPVTLISEFIRTNKTIKDEAAEVHGISRNELSLYGKNLDGVLTNIYFQWLNFGKPPFVAHNGSVFDRKMIEPKLFNAVGKTFETFWIDTVTDIPYPKHIQTRKLSYLASEHGFINPFPHRAVFDVLTMFKVLSHYNIEEVISISKSPMIKVIANVKFEEKHKAKDKGFYWNPDEKYWFKTMRNFQLEQVSLDFEYRVEYL